MASALQRFGYRIIPVNPRLNTEMTLIANLDLDNLKELRTHGSVHNFRDRRLDLYKVSWVGNANE